MTRETRIEQAGGVFGRVNGGIKWDLTPGTKVLLGGETTFGGNGGNEYAVSAAITVTL